MPGRVLFVASNPTAIKFDFARELEELKTAVQRRSTTFEILARWSVSVAVLKNAVTKMRPEVVHLLSPGVHPETNALVLSDRHGRPEYAQPDAVAAAFAGRRSLAPKLVVLNTCHSRSHAEAIAEHVGCVIAMDGEIRDDVAVDFARDLYSSLTFGDSVDGAFRRARTTVGQNMPTQRDVPALIRGRLDPATIRFATTARRPALGRPTTAVRSPAVPTPCAKIFCSYSHKDEKYRAELETHLALLARQGAVDVWHDRQIGPGHDWAREIDENLDHANLVLMLVSADFLASQYCYGIEMARALERAQQGSTRVVPILVRKCDLEGVPFGKLQWLPTGSRPIKNWTDRDSAWTDVAMGVRKVVQEIASLPASSRIR